MSIRTIARARYDMMVLRSSMIEVPLCSQNGHTIFFDLCRLLISIAILLSEVELNELLLYLLELFHEVLCVMEHAKVVLLLLPHQVVLLHTSGVEVKLLRSHVELLLLLWAKFLFLLFATS